ncbi:hypothetical protein VNO77_34276 [Canavalia gladiata]|uniref:Uncharacterized protein n=1 Tax=Canavalia gladiata TaxID=3824 RepID=A0AAN9Q1M7_CANGL
MGGCRSSIGSSSADHSKPRGHMEDVSYENPIATATAQRSPFPNQNPGGCGIAPNVSQRFGFERSTGYGQELHVFIQALTAVHRGTLRLKWFHTEREDKQYAREIL